MATALLARSAWVKWQAQQHVPRRSVRIAAMASAVMVAGSLFYGLGLEVAALVAVAGLVVALGALAAGRKGWSEGPVDRVRG
jgi:hypothetical protein